MKMNAILQLTFVAYCGSTTQFEALVLAGTARYMRGAQCVAHVFLAPKNGTGCGLK